MLLGYARVSTAAQNPDHQTDALIRVGVAAAAIYLAHASGAKASRPQLDQSSGTSAPATPWSSPDWTDSADQCCTWSPSAQRPATGHRPHLQHPPLRRQHELIIANTRDGLAAARARGRVGGRRPKLTPAQAFTPNSSTTPATTPSSKSPTCSPFPGPPSTGTSTMQPSANDRPAPTYRQVLSAGSCTTAAQTPAPGRGSQVIRIVHRMSGSSACHSSGSYTYFQRGSVSGRTRR